MTSPLPHPHSHPAVTCIVAADRRDGIARGSELPWHLPVDLARFKRLTVGLGHSSVLMGRATWDTLPTKWQPLPRRKNIVLTRGNATFHDATRVTSWADALAAAAGTDHLWVVGGAQIYALALAQPETTAIELTRIDHDFDCDVRWPGVPADFTLVASEPHSAKGIAYAFERWERRGLGEASEGATAGLRAT